ncbi:glycosyltransferase family 2 protein [Baileyella intestinalis]|uniref:glycosyltransferase family 2 protein n=1 Tax=Baileyella intestinalis TaxID=2606709 RepID=UPI003A861469
MKALIIIPAYNEEGAIVKTVDDIIENAPSFDYIVVNDCSMDSTKELLEKNHINHVNLAVNSGIGAAVQTGYIYACRNRYDYAVQIDGDGQHDAAFLEKMLSELQNSDANMVIGSRFLENNGFQSTGLRRVGIRFFTWWIRVLTHKTITDPTSGMRMVDRNIIKMFARRYPMDYPEPESVVVVLKNGYKVKEIPVEMRERIAGVSSISLRKSVYYMIKVTIACWIASVSSKWGDR